MNKKNRRVDNMLNLSTEACALTLDARLYSPTARYDENSKVGRAISLALETYHQAANFKGTTLIFSDFCRSDSNPGFNLYHDIRDRLVAKGIPRKEIAILPETPYSKVDSLVRKVKRGDVRIVIGSSERGGQGLNIQKRGATIIHLDAQWNLKGILQRNSRFHRLGNFSYQEHGWKLRIFNLRVKGTNEEVVWREMERKMELTNTLLSGKL